MKLPNQSKAIERKAYNANAVSVGANASFWGGLLSTALPMVKGALGAL